MKSERRKSRLGRKTEKEGTPMGKYLE